MLHGQDGGGDRLRQHGCRWQQQITSRRPEPGVQADSSVTSLVRVLIWSLTCAYCRPSLVVDSPQWSTFDGPETAQRTLGRPWDGPAVTSGGRIRRAAG